MDPHAVLDVPAGASAREITEAFRRAARRWHPDLNRRPEAAARMAELNAAYELLRSGRWQRRRRPEAAPAPAPTPTGVVGAPWLDEAMRRALGGELLAALTTEEPVKLVVPVATWASPSTLLAVTDRRLLWLLDDVPVNRVRFVRFRDLGELTTRRSRVPPRRTAVVEGRTLGRRKLAWAELRPATAEQVVALASHRHAEVRGGG